MGIDIEKVDGGIIVRPDDTGKWKRVATPVGFSTEAFKGAVVTFDTVFRKIGRTPSVDQLYTTWPRIPKKTYSGLLKTDEFAQALRYRGIELEENAGLSLEQQTVLLKLADPLDRRSLSVKLKELGVPMPRYQAWLKQPLFREHYEQQSIDNYAEALPAIRSRLIEKAESGERWATELIFAKTGEYNPAQQEVESARAIVLKVVEAVIRHVRDADTRKAILADVALYASTVGSIEQGRRQLEG
jgi:hypothetical protein